MVFQVHHCCLDQKYMMLWYIWDSLSNELVVKDERMALP
jgi:hypothetical protein